MLKRIANPFTRKRNSLTNSLHYKGSFIKEEFNKAFSFAISRKEKYAKTSLLARLLRKRNKPKDHAINILLAAISFFLL